MSRDIKKFICEVKSKSKTLQKRPSVQNSTFLSVSMEIENTHFRDNFKRIFGDNSLFLTIQTLHRYTHICTKQLVLI